MVAVQPELCESVSHFVARVHRSVNELSQVYLQNERRYNYTTPKSFLEQINLYQNLLRRKQRDLLVYLSLCSRGPSHEGLHMRA